MKVTEVGIMMARPRQRGVRRPIAFCSVVLDGEVCIKDIRVIQGTERPFVAMPCRKNSYPCPDCRTHNHLRAKFCSECGLQLPLTSLMTTEKLYDDVVHPTNTDTRRYIEGKILDALAKEMSLAEAPDYPFDRAYYDYDCVEVG